MELVSFHDRIYGKYKNQLFTFEPTWDSFRPITGIAWNGKRMIPVDDEYKKNLFDPYYGYGTFEMKKLCHDLIRETDLDNAKDIRDPVHLWRWYGEKNIKWWRDRPCVFATPCIEQDSIAWKKYLHYLEVRAKTLRRPMKTRMTKRLLPR